jgi:hypothetical protein
MKTSLVGTVSAAILMVLAGVGSGIALAGGDYTEGPVMTFEEQNAYEQGIVSNPDTQYTEDRPVLSFDDEMKLRDTIGTGNLPERSDADSSVVKYEIIDGTTWYRVDGKLYELYGP